MNNIQNLIDQIIQDPKVFSDHKKMLYSVRATGKSSLMQIMQMLEKMSTPGLEYGTGTVFGVEYHTVEPNFALHFFDVKTEAGKWTAMHSWCVETFGATHPEGAWVADQRWYANNAKFWFRNEADMMMFSLKWS